MSQGVLLLGPSATGAVICKESNSATTEQIDHYTVPIEMRHWDACIRSTEPGTMLKGLSQTNNLL